MTKESPSSRPQPPRRSKSAEQSLLFSKPKEKSTHNITRRAPNRSRSEQSTRSSISISLKSMANHTFFARARSPVSSRRVVEDPPLTRPVRRNPRKPPRRTFSDTQTDDDSHSDSRDFGLTRRSSWSITGTRQKFVYEEPRSHQFSHEAMTKDPISEPTIRKAPTKRRSFMQRIRSALPSRSSSVSPPPAPLIPLSALSTPEQSYSTIDTAVESELLDLPIEDPADRPLPSDGDKKNVVRFDPTSEESMMASLPFLSMSAEDEDCLRREYGLGASLTFTEDSFTCPSSDTQSWDKQVRFDHFIQTHEIVSCKTMSQEEKEGLWYNAEDRDQARRSARCSVFRASLHTPTQVTAIDSTYNNACYMAAILSESQLEAFYRNPVALARHGKSLIEWSCQAEETRGLEVLISDVHNSGRGEIASESRGMVVETSKLHRKQRNGRAGGVHELESISRQYKEMSKSATIMARLFGEADAWAAAQHDDEPDMDAATFQRISGSESMLISRLEL